MYPNNIGTDQLTIEKVLTILFILFVVVALAWISINVEEAEYKDIAFWYWVMGLTGLIWILLDFVLKKFDVEIIDTCLYEEETFFGRLSSHTKLLMFIGLMIVFFILFSFINIRQSALVNAPKFQAVELGNNGRILATILFAIVEGLFFIGCLAPTVYGGFRRLSGSPHFGLLAMLIITPSLFTLFHIAVYGFTDMLASSIVFIFNLTSCVMLFLLRNIFWEWTTHTANNAGLMFVKLYRFSLEILFIPLVVVLFLIMIVYMVMKR